MIAQTRFRCNYSTFSQKGGMSNLLREKKTMHKTMHMPASKSKRYEKLIRHQPEKKNLADQNKNPAKMFKSIADQ